MNDDSGDGRLPVVVDAVFVLAEWSWGVGVRVVVYAVVAVFVGDH